MNFETAIKKLYNSPQVKSKLLQYPNPQDLMQDALMKILKANRDFIMELINKGEFLPYFLKTIENTAKEKKALILCKELEIEIENEDYIEININFAELEKKKYFYAKILEVYLEQGSIRKVCQKTKIKKNSVFISLNNIKKLIKNEPEKYLITTKI